MPLTLPLEPGETVYLDSSEFGLGITDRAVFIPKKKIWAKDDPWFMQRVPRANVARIVIKRLRALPLLLLAAAMVIIGLVTTFFMLEPILAGQGGRVSGIPIGVLVAGLVLPFLVRGRFGVIVEMSDGTYKWKPPIVLDRASKDNIAKIFSMTASAARKAGLNVVDQR